MLFRSDREQAPEIGAVYAGTQVKERYGSCECSALDGQREPVTNSHFLQVFSSVNISDSKLMREMTEAAVRDSAGMSQGKNVA